jgi:hypothetical protein
LLETSAGLAIYAEDTYKKIGQVRKARREVRSLLTGNPVKEEGWSWWYDEEEFGQESGWAPTKDTAVEAVLDAGGYKVAPPNAANPGLF